MLDTFLLTCTTYDDFTGKFLSALRASDLKGKNCASKFEEYLQFEKNSGFLKEAERLKYQVADRLHKILPVSTTVSGRKKPIRSFVKKLDKNYPDLDRVRDEFAFRIIISDKVVGPETGVKFCYIATKFLIDFFLDKRFIIVQISVKQDDDIPESILENLYIPKIVEIPEAYFPFFKDYMSQPKANGYQGVHVLVRDSKTGRYFEFQIRTSSMHKLAEYGSAAHDGIYKPADDFPFQNINMPGFECDGDTIVNDEYGIINPLLIGNTIPYEVNNDPITWYC